MILIGSRDLKIAATALVNDALLLSANLLAAAPRREETLRKVWLSPIVKALRTNAKSKLLGPPVGA
jgi:hypothetical protein